MKQRFDFEEIRPLYDEEVPELMPSILKEEAIEGFAKFIAPEMPYEEFKTFVSSLKTKSEFQSKLIAPFLLKLAAKTADSLDITGLDKISKELSYTFISNHRDIILDAAFLNTLLIDAGYESAEVAIGDNLLIYPWIRNLARMNKSFIVKRDMPVRQLFEASRSLSAYINFALKIKGQSVWIAQREGRSKDSTDRTQESVVKMLAMGGGKDLLSSVYSLNIMPVSISYEYDPCDFLKAKEFQQKRDDVNFKKDKRSDLVNMYTGMMGYKGRIHFEITSALNEELDKLPKDLDKCSLVTAIAGKIDTLIHRNMRMYENNYIAYDLLNGTHQYSEHYDEAKKAKFEAYISEQLDKIELENKDEEYLRIKLLEMYANPLVNFIKATAV